MKRRAIGFTLIEITVVLLILAVVLTLAVPGLTRLYQRIQAKSEMLALTNRISALPLLAWSTGDEGTLEELVQRHIRLPQDWFLHSSDPIYIRANGVCSGGTAQLTTPAGVHELLLDPPFCAIRADRQ